MKPLSFDAVAKTIALFDYKHWSLSIVLAPNRDSFVGSRNNETSDAATQTLRDIADAYPADTVFAVTFGKEEKSNGGSKSQAIVFSLNPDAAAAANQPQPAAAQGLAGVQPSVLTGYVSRDDLDAILKRNQEMTEHRVRIAQEEAKLAAERLALHKDLAAFELQKAALIEERKKYQDKYGHVKDALDESAEAAIPELLNSLKKMFTGGGEKGGKTLAGAETETAGASTEYETAVDELGAYMVNTFKTPQELRAMKTVIEKMVAAQVAKQTETNE